MKSFLTLLFAIVLGAQTFGQKRYDYYMWPYGDNNKIEFTETVHLPKATNTDSIFILAKSFISNKFKSEKDSTSYSDDRRTLVCRGSFYIPAENMGEQGKGYVGFTLTISTYYKSYRYTFTNFEHFAQNPGGASGGPLENERAACGGLLFPARYWDEEKARAYYYIQTTIESLKEYMSKHTSG